MSQAEFQLLIGWKINDHMCRIKHNEKIQITVTAHQRDSSYWKYFLNKYHTNMQILVSEIASEDCVNRLQYIRLTLTLVLFDKI